jgi:hypothetical protein
MIIRDYDSTDQDISVMNGVADAQNNALATATVPANTQYSYNQVCEIIAGYAGAGTGTLTVTGTVGGNAWVQTFTITGPKGEQGFPFPVFDAGQTVTVTLAAGGAVGFLVVGFIPK